MVTPAPQFRPFGPIDDLTMTHRRRTALPVALILSLSLLGPVAAPQVALAQTSMEDPLDARDARRVERMEKVVRELRAIVFQGRDTGRPVVVQPAETDYRIEELNRRLTDLESVITRLTGQIETTNFELRQSRDKAAALESQLAAMNQKIAALEVFTGVPPAEDDSPSSGFSGPPPSATSAHRAVRMRGRCASVA